MEKITIRRPIGSTKIGDVIQGVGTVEDVFAQGGSDIRVVRHGYFGEQTIQKIEEVIEEKIVAPIQTIVENFEMNASEEDESIRAKVKSKNGKLKIAKEKMNKDLLDQSPMVDDEKQLLRG